METHIERMDRLLVEAVKAYGLSGVHKVAMMFPWQSEEEFNRLVESARDRGFIEPITITEDRVLIDGRNRICASIVIEKDVSKKVTTDPDPIQFIIEKNLARRNMSPSQLSMVAIGIEAALAEEAAARQLATLKQNQPKSTDEVNSPHRENPTKPIEVNLPQSEQSTPPVPKPQPKPTKRRPPQSRDTAAKMVGVSGQTVTRAKAVVKHSPALKQKVISGEVTVNEAYKEVKEKIKIEKTHSPEPISKKDGYVTLKTHTGELVEYPKPKNKSTFNQTNASVEWARWTWNPVTGCLHGCEYCYAREIATSHSMKPFYPVGFTPLFHSERLDAPSNTSVPKNIDEFPEKGRVFVCSMADLFGKWVPEEWINKVMDATLKAPDWEYLFLTKFPQRLHGLTLPESAWIGASIDMPSRVNYTLDALRKVDNVRVKWLSLEPLLDPLTDLDLTGIDWVVIGAQSATDQPDKGHVAEFSPPMDWIIDIILEARRTNTAIYVKSNLLGETTSQFPGMKLIQDIPTTIPVELPGQNGVLF